MKSKLLPFNPMKLCTLCLPSILLVSSLTCPAQWHYRWTVFDRDLGSSLTLDPYHSYVNLFYQIKKESPVYVYQPDEFKLYKNLLFRSYKPDYGLVEFTIYPTTALSSWTESCHKELYDEFTVYRDFNLLRSISGGQQEPWSVSLFAGQIAAFMTLDDQEELVRVADGASGLVLTGGLYEIFNNHLFRANWYRIEWKLKGSGRQGDLSHSWNIRLGYRYYDIPEISNTAILAFSRNRLNWAAYDWSVWQNSISEFQIYYPVLNGKRGISRLRLVYGKAIPFWKLMIGAGLGCVYENRRKYDADLKQFTPNRIKGWNFFVMPFAYW
jgi:hypothetical protein